MPRLTIKDGPCAGQQFRFNETVVIGRGMYCDVRIDDSTVSRRHAQISRDSDGNWLLRDLGSANGTLHNGKELSSEVILGEDSKLVFGEVPAEISFVESNTAQEKSERPFPQLLDRLAMLASISSLSARREDPQRLIAAALDQLLESFAACERASVFVMRPDGASLRVHTRRDRSATTASEASIELAKACLRQSDGFAGNASALGLPDAQGSLFAAPLQYAGETLGVLVAESAQLGVWNPLDQAIAKAIGSILAGVIESERSSDPERRVAERDLALARRVQQQFLPQSANAPRGYVVSDHYVPARAVGGDHFDYFRYADNRFGILIADVAGKAVSGALVMARLGMAVRLLAAQSSGPIELLTRLNTIMCNELEAGMFVTAQALAISAPEAEIEVVNAGHPPPLCRDAQGAVTEMRLATGAALGIIANIELSPTVHFLDAGTCVLLHSDGLVEAENENTEAFGIERAMQALASGEKTTAALDFVTHALAAFVGDTPASDDLTLVLLSRPRG